MSKNTMAEGLVFRFGVMVRKLKSLADDELTLAWKFQNKLKNLEENLIMISALIRDTFPKNKAPHVSVKVWFEQLSVVASDVDHLLEDFAYETLRYKVENSRRDKLLALMSPSKNPLLLRLKLVRKIKKLKKSVDDMFNRGTEVRRIDQLFGHLDVDNTDFDNEMRTNRFLNDSEIVGRESDVLNVVKMLCDDDDDKNLSVIAIVGPGGQGKTTLAQLVCKNEKVVKHFDNLIIWVYVSKRFVHTTLLKEMVSFFTGRNSQLSNVENIVYNELGPKLKDKRYLLVLDDVWNEDEDKWDAFQTYLSAIRGAKGSKVMVTTRSNKVASTMHASSYILGQLSDEGSWTMFKQIAIAHGEPLTDTLTNIGKEIVKRCNGLPLAIKAIARLLCSNRSESYWLSLQKSELWNMEDSTERVMQTLKLT